MIFVSFGNSPVPFPRLAEAVDKMALKLGEAVIVQSGYTLYPFKHCTCTSFFDQLTYKGCLKACSVAVLQGGWGGYVRPLIWAVESSLCPVRKV